MVIQNAINSVKEKPHEEKKAVATSIAVGVVVVLLVGWGFLFLRKIQKGSMPTLEGAAVPQDQVDAAFIQQTQQQLNQFYQSQQDQLRDIRDSSAQSEADTGYTSESVEAGDGGDAFGTE